MNSQPHNVPDTVDTPKANGAIATASSHSDKKTPAKRQCVAPSSTKQLVVTETSPPPFSASNPPPLTAANNELISSLPVDILLAIALCLDDVKDIARLEQTNHRWRQVLRSNEEIWRNLCAHYCKKYRHYKALALDEAEWSRNHPRWGVGGTPPDLQTTSDGSSCIWKKRYQWVEMDRTRTEFHSTAELESLSWCWESDDNPNPIERCQFRDGTLITLTFDIGTTLTDPDSNDDMPYTLEPIDQNTYQRLWDLGGLGDAGGLLPGRQGLRIIDMGQGDGGVARVESSGEWVIILPGHYGWMFASCNDKGRLEYENSLFQMGEEARHL